MSTRYYMSTKNREYRDVYFDHYELVDSPDFGYEESIGHFSLRNFHFEYGYSLLKVKLMMQTKQFIIYDEYNEILTFEDFSKIVNKEK